MQQVWHRGFETCTYLKLSCTTDRAPLSSGREIVRDTLINVKEDLSILHHVDSTDTQGRLRDIRSWPTSICKDGGGGGATMDAELRCVLHFLHQAVLAFVRRLPLSFHRICFPAPPFASETQIGSRRKVHRIRTVEFSC